MLNISRLRPAAVTLWLGLCLLLPACSTLQPNFEKPTVTLTSIRLGQAQGLEQRFIVGLRVVNPNRVALPVEGMSYTLNLEGYDLANGVANNIAPIPAYGESTIDVDVAVNLFNSMRFMQNVLTKPVTDLHYQFNAKLDIGNVLLPNLRVSEAGVIPLTR